MIQLMLFRDFNRPIVACVVSGKSVRVKPLSKKYDRSKFCRFPRQLRVAGAMYSCAELRDAGSHYVAIGPFELLPVLYWIFPSGKGKAHV